MVQGIQRLLIGALLLLVMQCDQVVGKMMSKDQLRAKQAAAAERFAVTSTVGGGPGTVRNITFSNPKASGMSATQYASTAV